MRTSTGPPDGHGCPASDRWALTAAATADRRITKDDEEGIAFGTPLHATVLGERVTEQSLVLFQDQAIGAWTQRGGQLRGAFDVTEQERDGAGRESIGCVHVGHSTPGAG